MLGALVLVLTGNFQGKALEPPLFLQHRFDRVTIAKSEESERNRQALITALEQQKWTLALDYAKRAYRFYEDEWNRKDVLIEAHLGQLMIVAGKPEEALTMADRLTAPFVDQAGTVVTTWREWLAYTSKPHPRDPYHTPYSWLQGQSEGLWLKVEAHLARLEFREALAAEERLVSMKRELSVRRGEGDDGRGYMEFEGYLPLIRATVLGDTAMMRTYGEGRFPAWTYNGYGLQPQEQRFAIAVFANYVFGLFEQSRGRFQSARTQFEKAKAVMLQRAGYLANREVLHWHQVKNLLRGHAKTNTSPTPKASSGGGNRKVTSLP